MVDSPIKLGILGSGATAVEMERLLEQDSDFRIVVRRASNPAESTRRTGLSYEDLSPRECSRRCDFLISCADDEISLQFVPAMLDAGRKCIDVSGAYRLRDHKQYERTYRIRHTDRENLKTAVYGLPEYNEEAIRRAMLVANPGSFSTAILLGLLPACLRGWLTAQSTLSIRAVSGWIGLGTKSAESPEVSVARARARHRPEILQGLKELGGLSGDPAIRFDPTFSENFERGILAHMQWTLPDSVDLPMISEAYRAAFSGSRTIRLSDTPIQATDAAGGNDCLIALSIRDGILTVVVAIDNLGKGGAGQAVQNLRLMTGREGRS